MTYRDARRSIGADACHPGTSFVLMRRVRGELDSVLVRPDNRCRRDQGHRVSILIVIGVVVGRCRSVEPPLDDYRAATASRHG
jgi:hypothetical protein